ncbi:hypothetical protein I316_03824 [Kwoniella heveanensis BCC8398]|uniref:Galactose oxidase n=1 Tax=Kwoniella heveanensis BCC8398 TaxID=1296120 RepID=A0A1B9GTB6_9TREE|nr:hypothetical protein I316_03824 [Kwoniella heveanensis BCC8398]
MSRRSQSNNALYAIALAAGMPVVLAMTPAARWGHQAVYVKSKQAMYVVGGEVPTSSSEITNEVLILPLNTTNPSFSTGSSSGLPPHAFASLVATSDGSSLVVAGGMTPDCSSDGTAHTLNLDGSASEGWVATTPTSFLRRRGTGAAIIEDGSDKGKLMVVGGIADSYSCSSSTYAFPAADILSLPLSSSSLVSTRNLPTSLTGSTQAVSDFALTTDASGKVYLTGGQSSSGEFVDMTTVGIWDSTNGWTSQTTSGEVPSGRVGASLVAHPTLDLLVLHGGSTDSAGTASALLSFLNTTSWTWSTPSNLQPPGSSAKSYHTSVMTDQGVMITAFGLASAHTPRSDVYYLDMRDPSGSAWSWKSTWNSNMLTAYSGSSTTTSGGTTDTSATTGTGGVNTAQDNANGSGGMSSKKITSITVPILVVALLLSPIIIYLIRRRMRVMKKRRMARHFSFSSQEDEGAFSSNPFQQYLAKRRTKTQFPFGRDANEKEGNLLTDMTGGLTRMITRLSDRSNSDDVHGPGSGTAEREMMEVQRSPKVRFTDKPGKNQPMNWEEIDFGLGKLDESKHLDPSFTNNNNDDVDSSAIGSAMVSPFADDAAVGPASTSVNFHIPDAVGPATASTQGYAPEMLYNDDVATPAQFGRLDHSEVGNARPAHDGQASLIPSLFVQPATAPTTPAVNSLSTAYPAMVPTPASAVGGASVQDGLDWNQLQSELENKPAFRSISPTAQLRSHAHSQSAQLPSQPQPMSRTGSDIPRPASPAPSIPPLDFQRRPSSSGSSTGTITLVHSSAQAQAQAQAQLGRRPHEDLLPFASNMTSRSVSQPVAFGRQIAGGLGRRGSAPYAQGSGDSPLSSGQTTPTGRPLSMTYSPGMRRASGGNIYPMGAALTATGSPVNSERRASMLRVVNVTEDETIDDDMEHKGHAV